MKLNAYRSAIAAPIYLKQPGFVNCTYDISSDHNASVALSFSKLNITKGSVIVWDGEGKTSDPVINYTSKYFEVLIDSGIFWKNHRQITDKNYSLIFENQSRVKFYLLLFVKLCFHE